MGKNSKEHRQRVARRNALLNNPLARGAVALASRGKVIDELNRATTAEQIEVLNDVVAPRDSGKLRRAIERRAPREMDKGITKLLKEGREVTVEALTEEVKTTPGFLGMCEKVGLTLGWFEDLARKRMEANKI